MASTRCDRKTIPRLLALRGALSLCVILIAGAQPGVSRAQYVQMSGDYHESAGLFNFPFNGPSVPCDPNVANARCHPHDRKSSGGDPLPQVLSEPAHGITGVTTIQGQGPGGGLAVGDPFTIPTSAFTRMVGVQTTQRFDTVNGFAAQFETNYTYVLPAAARAKGAPATTRQFAYRTFSQATPDAHGQNDGNSLLGNRRQNISTNTTWGTVGTIIRVSMQGGNGFSGTMAALIKGNARTLVSGPLISGLFSSSLAPVVLSQPVHPSANVTKTMIGAGWKYTLGITPGVGRFKSFSDTPSVVGPTCVGTSPPSPTGCQLVSGFDTLGTTVANGAEQPGTTRRVLFPWTTGTVSVVWTNDLHLGSTSNTLTAMGYDTTTLSSMGGQVRNVGLVAGSMTVRQRDFGPNFGKSNQGQVAGLNLKFTPEPGTTTALIVGLMALTGWHRRSAARSNRSIRQNP